MVVVVAAAAAATAGGVIVVVFTAAAAVISTASSIELNWLQFGNGQLQFAGSIKLFRVSTSRRIRQAIFTLKMANFALALAVSVAVTVAAAVAALGVLKQRRFGFCF